MGRKSRGYPTAEFRLTLSQKLSPMLGCFIGVFVAWLGFSMAHQPAGATFLPFVFVWIGGVLGALIGPSHYGVTLTPWTAEVHGLRQRVIWWPDVEIIRVERVMLTRRIVIYEYGGRRTRLRAPITGFLLWDGHFAEKYHAIGRWWLEHRMIQPGPAGPVDAPPAGLPMPVDDAVPSWADAPGGDARPPRRD